MKQLELEFFWPLTEQVPLDLDYASCEPPKLAVNYNTGVNFAISPIGTTNICMEINPSKLTVDVDAIVIKQKQKPSFLRRMVYKALGVNWELK